MMMAGFLPNSTRIKVRFCPFEIEKGRNDLEKGREISSSSLPWVFFADDGKKSCFSLDFVSIVPSSCMCVELVSLVDWNEATRAAKLHVSRSVVAIDCNSSAMVWSMMITTSAHHVNRTAEITSLRKRKIVKGTSREGEWSSECARECMISSASLVVLYDSIGPLHQDTAALTTWKLMLQTEPGNGFDL